MRDLSREQNSKKKGILPSDTIANPKSSGSGPTSHVMSITTRSGKVLQGGSEHVVEVEESEHEVEVEEPRFVEVEKGPEELKVQQENRDEVKEKVKETPKTLPPISRPPLPFPQGLARKVDDSKLEKFYDILKKLSMNIPFVEAFQEMSGFAKYLKYLIAKKRTTKNKVVNVTHRVSSIISTSTVQKKEDRGAFTILCTIGAHDFARALCDNGASIKLMPLAIYKQAGLEVTFQASKGKKLPHEYESISVIDVVDEVEDAVKMKMEEQCLGEALAAILVNFDGEDMEGYMEWVEQLLEVLKEHRQAIGWTIVDIRGILLGICEHKINLESETKPSVEHQRRLNPFMQEVVKKEIIKWLDAGVVYPIADSFLKLNSATCKDHFLMPFIDQMLDWQAGKSFYFFLDGYSGYNQINIALEDQEKTTFTCPYGTFAFSRIPFGLCNAPSTFQKCMMSIFSDMVEDFLEVFMDDFLVVGDSFEHCLNNLRQVLKRCEETNLVLNWEKCHFMVDEGIVLGHQIMA
ncbi:uncharacterized protein [Nicotiana sylvestris]|uniref:uncharacterized protein n=1 Tax=Nicotiana sylvestris TaxID=4096 RepID=UPI00388CCE3E